MSQKIYDNLQSLGLTANEAEIYVALVDRGPCFVAPIIAHTKKHRQVVYNALDILEKKQLVFVTTKNGKKWYSVASPDNLLIMIREQENLATDVIENIKQRQRVVQETTEVMRGLDAYKRSIEEFSRYAIQAKEYLVINSNPSEYGSMIKKNIQNTLGMQREIKKDGGDVRILIFEENAPLIKEVGMQKEFCGDPFETRIIKTIPKPPHTIWISGDFVYLRTKMSEPVITKIMSNNLAGQYRDYFYKLWEDAVDYNLN